MVCGHTHHQFELRAGEQRVVNAGSVGMPYEGEAGAYWLLVADGEPELRRTEYDVEAAGAALRASGFPDVDDLIRESLLEPVDAALRRAPLRGRAQAPDSGLSLQRDTPDSGMFVCGHLLGNSMPRGEPAGVPGPAPEVGVRLGHGCPGPSTPRRG